MNLEIKQFKDEQEAISTIMMKFCNDPENPILDDDEARKFAEKIVETIPAPMRGQYSDNIVIAAAQYADNYIEANKSGRGDVTVPGNGLSLQNSNNTESSFDKHAIPAMPDQAQKVIDSIVSGMDREQRERNTMNSKVTKYLYKNEPFATLLGVEYVEVHPEISSKTLQKIEKNLVETEENKANWERIKELLKDPTSKVKARLNDKLGTPEGVIIKTEGSGEGSNKSKETVYNRETLISFLFLNTVLKVGSDKESGLGVKVKGVEQKEVKKKNGQVQTKGSISLTYTGRKEIQPKYYDFINKPVKDDKGNFETKERSISTELTVEVYVERVDSKTGAKKRVVGTQRIRGKYNLPIFSRDAKYVEVFGSPENRDFIDSNVTDEDFAAAEAQTQMLLALAATKKVGDVSKFGSEFTQMVNKIKEASDSKVDTASMGI